jgi:PAS domain S-box-containing protein
MSERDQFFLPALLKDAVDRMAYHVMVTDKDGTIVYVNPAFERTTGYLFQEVVGKNPRILKSGEQPLDYYKSLWASILDGKEFTAVIRNRKKSGEMYFAYQQVSPIRDAKGQVTHLVSTWEDVTARRNAEHQHDLAVDDLKRQVEGLERSNHAIEILFKEVERKDAEIARLKAELARKCGVGGA